MQITSDLRQHRGLALLGVLAACMIPVLAGAASADAATPRKAPPKAAAVKGPLSKADKQRLEARARLVRSQIQRAAIADRGAVAAKSTVTVTCDPYQQAYWGYWMRCHVVQIGGIDGYSDYFEYSYWNGRYWALWYVARI